MSVIFIISVIGLLLTLPLHIISIKYNILESRLGKARGEKVNKILGQISGDGHYIFCLGIWLAPQPRFYFPIFKSMVTIPVVGYDISIFHLVIAAPFIILFILIELYAVKSLSMETSVTHKAEKVIKNGIYATIRHPQHLGHLLGYSGMTILFSGLYALYFFPVLFIVVIILSLAEEAELVKHFGTEYREYQKSVPFLIPFLKKNAGA
jgi:protein-S-isoprenylcysteine O-methyltransferase Ste14